jgi:hypothetical protein
MKRLFKITLFSFLTIMLLSFCPAGKNMKSYKYFNSSYVTIDDSTNVIRYIAVDTFRLPVLPPSSGVQFYKDRIVFLSLTKNEKKMSPNQISFGTVEAYYAPVEDSVSGRHVVFSPLSPFTFPCEAMTFSRNYNTIYYTKIPRKDKKEKIFMAKFDSNRKGQTALISENTPLSFCTDDYSYTHPALSADEKMLIFASDRKGSLGGMDLFVSKKVNDKWSSPENLGKQINTSGNEFFPFLDSENNLFFSSDKLSGYGGFDIFTSKFNGKGWDKPINLSDRINSDKDDIAFTINKTDGKTAFFTRRQRSGNSEMQLFRVTLKRDAPKRNLLTLSDIFNGKAEEKPVLTAANNSNEIKPVEAEPAKTLPETKIVKTDEVRIPEKTVVPNKPVENANIPKTETKIPPVENNAEPVKTTLPSQSEKKDVVIFRIQLLPSASEKNAKVIVLNGTSYKIYEYFYLGVNRYTIGEFSTPASAAVLQKICRQAGYAQSFVVAFKNNVRSLDPNLFK